MALDWVLRRRLDRWFATLPEPADGVLSIITAALRQLDDAVHKIEERLDSPEWREGR